MIYKITRSPMPVPVAVSTSVSGEAINADANIQNPSKEEIEQIVKNYLINNPEVIVESVEKLQKQKKMQNEDKVDDYLSQNKEDLERTSSLPWIGNESGDVTIIALYDYACSYCKTGDHYLHQLIDVDKDVKVIFQPCPILGNLSTFSAKVALAAYKLFPEKFANLHANLMNLRPMSNDGIIAAVNSAEIDYAAITEEMDKEEIQNILKKNQEVSRNLKINGVPAYIINGKLISGLINLNQFQQLLASARSKKLSSD